MAQGRWAWGIFYLLLAIALAGPTMFIGSIIVAIIAAMHSGMAGDAPKQNALTDEDIKKLAAAMKQEPPK